jgi:NAD(P)-dependent dehydrogenase (short-subunit alcohol dehydrogenase family)
MAGRLEGRHVLVTGGARGIGAAIAGKALVEGALVSIIDVDETAGRELLAGLGAETRACFSAGDVRRASDIARGLDAATRLFGPVSGLVNNAGRNVYADPVTMTEQEWEDVFAVDLKSAWLAARAVLPAMKAANKGAIVNIASLHADMTYPGMFPYAAAKSGLVGLTRSLALEVGQWQVRVNALSPGYVETALVAEFFGRNDASLREKVLAAHPMRRMGSPEEIANCAIFLLSDEASFVTGANWRVDGGPAYYRPGARSSTGRGRRRALTGGATISAGGSSPLSAANSTGSCEQNSFTSPIVSRARLRRRARLARRAAPSTLARLSNARMAIGSARPVSTSERWR